MLSHCSEVSGENLKRTRLVKFLWRLKEGRWWFHNLIAEKIGQLLKSLLLKDPYAAIKYCVFHPYVCFALVCYRISAKRIVLVSSLTICLLWVKPFLLLVGCQWYVYCLIFVYFFFNINTLFRCAYSAKANTSIKPALFKYVDIMQTDLDVLAANKHHQNVFILHE